MNAVRLQALHKPMIVYPVERIFMFTAAGLEEIFRENVAYKKIKFMFTVAHWREFSLKLQHVVRSKIYVS